MNYIRTNTAGPEDFVSATTCFWDDEKYLKPVEFEEWLMFGMYGLLLGIFSCTLYYFFFLDFEGLNDNASEAGVKSDKQQISDLLALLSAKNELLEQAASDMDTLKTKFREVFEEKSDTGITSTESGKTVKASSSNCVGSVPLQQDEGYFQTYSHYGIHHEMLSVSFR